MKCGDDDSTTVIVPYAWLKVQLNRVAGRTHILVERDEGSHNVVLDHVATRQWKRLLQLYTDNKAFFLDDPYYMTRALQASVCISDEKPLLQMLSQLGHFEDRKGIILRAARNVLCQCGIEYIYRSDIFLSLLETEYRINWVNLMFQNRFYERVIALLESVPVEEMADSQREFFVDSHITLGDLDVARKILMDYPMLVPRYRLAVLSGDAQLAKQLLGDMLASDDIKMREYADEVKAQTDEYYSRFLVKQKETPNQLPRARVVDNVLKRKSAQRKRRERGRMYLRSFSRRLSSLLYVKLS